MLSRVMQAIAAVDIIEGLHYGDKMVETAFKQHILPLRKPQ